MTPPEADHIEQTVQQMAKLHAEHYQNATRLQRAVDRTTSTLGHPWVVTLLLAVALLWIVGNLAATRLGAHAFDGPPFPLLELIATVFALFTTVLILVTQRREDEAARHRAQLTLQLAALSEQKIAKVISLLEEQRRESPILASRPDQEADEMAKAADPRRVLDRIIETHEGTEAK